jgi:hypothetical protein
MKQAGLEGPPCTLVVRARSLGAENRAGLPGLRRVSGIHIVVWIAGCTRHAQVLDALTSKLTTASSVWVCW